jgi:hypothetical protein
MTTDDRHRAGRCRSAAVVALLILANCSSLDAFEGPQASDDEHTLCYNRAKTSPDQLHALAAEACAGTTPRFLRQGTDFSACPLLVPMRLAFACGGS